VCVYLQLSHDGMAIYAKTTCIIVDWLHYLQTVKVVVACCTQLSRVHNIGSYLILQVTYFPFPADHQADSPQRPARRGGPPYDHCSIHTNRAEGNGRVLTSNGLHEPEDEAKGCAKDDAAVFHGNIWTVQLRVLLILAVTQCAFSLFWVSLYQEIMSS